MLYLLLASRLSLEYTGYCKKEPLAGEVGFLSVGENLLSSLSK